MYVLYLPLYNIPDVKATRATNARKHALPQLRVLERYPETQQ